VFENRPIDSKLEEPATQKEAGLHYPLGTIRTLPRAYDILGPVKEYKGENKNKDMKK
jgi:hypothetical protein